MFHFLPGSRVLGMELEKARLESGIRSEMESCPSAKTSN